MKLCECGCGSKTGISTKTDRAKGHVKGQAFRYLPFHKARVLWKGVDPTLHPQWKGGRGMTANGYVWVHMPGHPRANQGMIYEHVAVAERALGYHLPPKAQVHHVNEMPSDNRPCNLVICEDIGYHKLLHARMRAFKAGELTC